jgi:KDO2-lipid IV(A) lauroyltransferase
MYHLVYGLLYLISLLPFWILYGISNFAYVLLYYVVGYRKDIVLSNLAIAFPEKSLEERKRISKAFYRNFTDNFIEIIKLLSISEKELKKRFTGEFDIPNNYYESGRNIQYHLGHFFNWEYANLSLSLQSIFPVLVVYMPITNKAMDRLFNTLRTRFGAKMIAATNYLKDFKPYSRQRFSIIFVGDQSAGNTETAYWLPFFGKLTPFVTGPEKSARLSDTVALYAQFLRVKRGHYHVKFFELTNEPRKLAEGEIMKRTIQFLEKSIKEQPENYLWTHRRWKHIYDLSKHRAL